MAIREKSNGAWEEISDLRIKVNGAYESADHANAKVNGAWEEVWSSVRYRCIGKVFGNSTNQQYTPNGTSAYIKFYYKNSGIYLRFPDISMSKGESVTIECTLDSINTGTIDVGGYSSGTGYYGMSGLSLTPVVGKNTWTYKATSYHQQLVLEFKNEAMGSNHEFNISNLRINGVLCEFE